MKYNFFKDKDGIIVIAQRPNAPSIAWAICSVIAYAAKGTVGQVFSIAGSVALVIWAILEITKGVNGFRRTLGGLVLVLTAATIVMNI